jgi:hypothetical protein
MKSSLPIYLVLFCLVVPNLSLCKTGLAIDKRPIGTELTVEDLLGVKEDQRFARAVKPRTFVFPQDQMPGVSVIN